MMLEDFKYCCSTGFL